MSYRLRVRSDTRDTEAYLWGFACGIALTLWLIWGDRK